LRNFEQKIIHPTKWQRLTGGKFSPWRWRQHDLRKVDVILRSYPASNRTGLSSGQYPLAEPDIWHFTLTDGQFQVSEWEEKRGNHAVGTYRISNMQTGEICGQGVTIITDLKEEIIYRLCVV
jgi:hypothetical protein